MGARKQAEQPMPGTEQPDQAEAVCEKHKVVVLAFAGTEDLMEALWDKNFAGTAVMLSIDPDGEPAHELLKALAEIMGDKSIDKDFILVQPNLFPVIPCDLEKLQIPMVYTKSNGDPVYSSRIPTRLNKDTLAELMGAIEKEEDFVPETFFKQATAIERRPIAVGHHFGNVVAQILSGNPCRNKVIGALLTKHYIGASFVGFNAVKDILQEFLNSKR